VYPDADTEKLWPSYKHRVKDTLNFGVAFRNLFALATTH
jgi:hypothetical protein